MAEQNYGNKEQLIDILNSMKFPVMGAGGGFAPIGTENYFDGTTAPQGWLICDGSTHNIADYPELATYIASHHGSVNYYGGDGITTFAVPTRSGMPNSGIDTPDEHIVGERRETIDGVLKKKPLYEKEIDFGQMPSGRHADETLYTFSSDIDFVVLKDAYGTSRCDSLPSVYASDAAYSINVAIKKVDNLYRLRIDTGTSVNGTIFGHVMGIVQYTKSTDSYQTVQEGHSSDGNGVFCIRATVSGDPNAHVYSTEEQVVGKDENGNDVYEITLKGNVPANATSIFSMVGKTFLEATGRVRYGNDGGYVPIGWYYNSDNCIRINTQDSSDGLLIYWSGSLFANQPYRIIVKYTKTTD